MRNTNSSYSILGRKRHVRIPLIFFIFFLSTSLGYSQAQLKVLNYLYKISGNHTIAGQQAMQYRDTIDSITGHYPGLWGEDFSFYPAQGTTSLSQWRSLIVTKAKQVWAKGDIVALMFHACPPTSSEPCNWNGDVLSHLTDVQWDSLITDGTTLNKNWKSRLDEIVPYLQELKNSGVEVLFRLFHEMNQGAFWWGGRPGPNGTAKLYQISHDYLESKGLTNLIWVWNLQDFSTLYSDVNTYDPGSKYWDVLALDVYWSDGQGYTTQKYNIIKNKAAGKPIAIGECGTLPSSGLLTAQPRWSYFMGWAELTQQDNSNFAISNLYNSSNVITEDKMPGWIDSTIVDSSLTGIPSGLVIQNYPNPFNATTSIKYGIESNSIVILKIYNALGKEVETLVSGEEIAGFHQVIFDGSHLPSGNYFCTIRNGNYFKTLQIVLLK